MKKLLPVLLVTLLFSMTFIKADVPENTLTTASSIQNDSIPQKPGKKCHCSKTRKGKLAECKKGCDTNFNFSDVDAVVNKGLADSAYPGAVLCIGYKGKLVYEKAYGHYTYEKDAKAMNTDAMFDMASVTKVIATTTAAMILYDEGKLQLDKKVCEYLPAFANHGKETITIRNLLLHNSGLPAFKLFYKTCKTPKEMIADIMNLSLDFPVGAREQYSCIGMITLQQVMEKISGEPLDKFLKKRVFGPLGMTRTMYKPSGKFLEDCVPTEMDNLWRKTICKGIVHDEAAYLLGGVSGNAGLFSTAKDAAVFLQMILQKGSYNKHQYIKPSTIETWTKVQGTTSTRGLGWDTKSPEGSSAGHKFSPLSYGHTGFTGTSVWTDPERQLFVVFLTNRVYPTRENNKLSRVRPALHDEIVKTLTEK